MQYQTSINNNKLKSTNYPLDLTTMPGVHFGTVNGNTVVNHLLFDFSVLGHFTPQKLKWLILTWITSFISLSTVYSSLHYLKSPVA